VCVCVCMCVCTLCVDGVGYGVEGDEVSVGARNYLVETPVAPVVALLLLFCYIVVTLLLHCRFVENPWCSCVTTV
jgi:hypothetical protein